MLSLARTNVNLSWTLRNYHDDDDDTLPEWDFWILSLPSCFYYHPRTFDSKKEGNRVHIWALFVILVSTRECWKTPEITGNLLYFP
jgi:hypothetical protein